MTINKLFKTIFTTAFALGLAGSTMLISDQAEARRGGKEFFVKQYDVDKPLHGYEGHAGRGYYCSYKRLPKRECSWNGSSEKCRVVGWTLEQTCY